MAFAYYGFPFNPGSIRALSPACRKQLKAAMTTLKAPPRGELKAKPAITSAEQYAAEMRGRADSVEHTARGSIYRGAWKDGGRFEFTDPHTPECQALRALASARVSVEAAEAAVNAAVGLYATALAARNANNIDIAAREVREASNKLTAALAMLEQHEDTAARVVPVRWRLRPWSPEPLPPSRWCLLPPRWLRRLP